ncbi:hypothetical protein HN011_007827, partial [Eciton burchellii]
LSGWTSLTIIQPDFSPTSIAIPVEMKCYAVGGDELKNGRSSARDSLLEGDDGTPMRATRSATVSAPSPLETQCLEVAERSEPFHLEERTRKCALRGAPRGPKYIHFGKEKRAVINA